MSILNLTQKELQLLRAWAQNFPESAEDFLGTDASDRLYQKILSALRRSKSANVAEKQNES